MQMDSLNPWHSPGSGLSEASEVQDSYNTLLQRLTEPQPQTPQRPRIITKYDFMQTRQEKSAPSLAVPAPFTISTGLTVTEKEQEAARRRGGRSFRIGRYCLPLALLSCLADRFHIADSLLFLEGLFNTPCTVLSCRYFDISCTLLSRNYCVWLVLCCSKIVVF